MALADLAKIGRQTPQTTMTPRYPCETYFSVGFSSLSSSIFTIIDSMIIIIIVRFSEAFHFVPVLIEFT